MKPLAAFMWCALSAAPSWAEMDRASLLGLSASVLKIEATRVQGGFSLGSGVVVGPEQVVTNCHVTHDALKVNVLRGGVRWLADSQLSDVARDLCLLRVPGLRASAVALGRADRLAPGQPVTALGYTGGQTLQNSPGEVLALHRFDGSRVIRSSNWFSSGASGGGLFDEDLRLVGILSFRLRGGEAHYFAAPAEWVGAMLNVPGDVGYSEVAPDRSQRVAYWQKPVRDQPWFLQAALLQRDDQWPALAALGKEWARADASDPEPWYMMSVALARMNQPVEAKQALACSLALDPNARAERARLEAVHDGAELFASTVASCVKGATPSATP